MLKTVRLYVTAGGRCPFQEWLDDLGDHRGKAKIHMRLNRLRAGLLGEWRSIGSGVIELKERFGPGYRIYGGLQGDACILILCAGDKGSQKPDIVKARAYWEDFKHRYEN